MTQRFYRYNNSLYYSCSEARCVPLKFILSVIKAGHAVDVRDRATGHNLSAELKLRAEFEQKLAALRAAAPLPPGLKWDGGKRMFGAKGQLGRPPRKPAQAKLAKAGSVGAGK